MSPDRLPEELRRWVELESPSGDAARVSLLAEEIARALERTGAQVEQLEAHGAGRHVRASLEGRQPELAPLLLLGHLDTVHPAGTIERRPFQTRAGRAHGPGIFDMKAGLVVMLEALRRLAQQSRKPRRAVRVLITCDEETGSRTSRALIEETARSCSAVLVLEPPLPNGAAKTARKGVATYRLEVTGRAAHAGVDPERGASATAELAQQSLRVLALADSSQGTTLNIGRIGGGTAVNVVAAEAWAEVDVRFGNGSEEERVAAALGALRPVVVGTSVRATLQERRPPLERTAGVVALYEQARTAAAVIGFELGEGSTGGGSDGCFTAALGIPTLDGLGVQGGGAHAEDEHILLEDVPRRIALLVRLLEAL